jgi:hypothetical protein
MSRGSGVDSGQEPIDRVARRVVYGPFVHCEGHSGRDQADRLDGSPKATTEAIRAKANFILRYLARYGKANLNQIATACYQAGLGYAGVERTVRLLVQQKRIRRRQWNKKQWSYQLSSGGS